MDTAINAWMIAQGFDPQCDDAIAVCAASSCEYLASASFPETLEVGIGVERLGTTSITWRLGILRPGEDDPIATGRFVHVFVDEARRRPMPVPAALRTALVDELGADGTTDV